MISRPAPGPARAKVELVDLDAVLDLSADVGVDSWMADNDTNLRRSPLERRAQRARGDRDLLCTAVAIVQVVQFLGNRSSSASRIVNTVPADAAVREPIHDIQPDAGDGTTLEQKDAVALSKFGFFSLTSNAKTMIYVADKMIGETPLTRLRLKPGPHTG